MTLETSIIYIYIYICDITIGLILLLSSVVLYYYPWLMTIIIRRITLSSGSSSLTARSAMSQGLRLIDVGPAIRGHVKDSALFDLPNGLVEILPGEFIHQSS